MKTVTVLIVALLAVSVVKTQVKEFTTAVEESTTWTGKKDGDVVLEEYTRTDGQGPEWDSTTENRLEMRDGKLVNVTVTKKQKVDKHTKVQKVKRIIHSQYKISDALSIVKAYGQEVGQPLTKLELELFNTIGITNGNKFSMQYDVQQIKLDELRDTLRHLSKIFSVKLDEDDIQDWANQIETQCPEGYLAFPLDTTDLDNHRPDHWEVRTELLIVTCGNEDKTPVHGYQLFAWAAQKEGTFRKGQYSEPNAKTLQDLMRRWLFTNMQSMVDCSKDEVACAVISEYSATSQDS